jgi:hypothetical protein
LSRRSVARLPATIEWAFGSTGEVERAAALARHHAALVEVSGGVPHKDVST